MLGYYAEFWKELGAGLQKKSPARNTKRFPD
jgi:hypothetical protein